MPTEPSQTESWVAAAQGGDRVALAKLLATYHPQLRAHAAAQMDAATQSRIAPEDILQEVYLDVARELDRFENRGSGAFLGWLYAILNNKLVDVRRAAHRQRRDIEREVPALGRDSDSYWNLLDDVYAESATPSRVTRRDEALGALVSCLAGLSEAHQQVIRLRFLEGLPVAEVAQRLGRTEGAVVALSQRALRALREQMDRLGEFTHGD